MTDERMIRIEELLRDRGETVTTAESCTGGMVAARITDIAGSSDIFKRGFVTYSDEAKHDMIGVSTETLRNYTAVSAQTAREMAIGAARAAGAQAAVSVTGYAGPGDPDDPDNGLVYTGCFYRDNVEVRENHYKGDRSRVREQAMDTVLGMLLEVLEKE